MGGAEHGHGGEAAHGDFRAKVWSMTGGPFCRPKHWKRNTAITMAGVFLMCIPIAMKSAELEQRPHHPVAQFLPSSGARILEPKTTEVVQDHQEEKYLLRSLAKICLYFSLSELYMTCFGNVFKDLNLLLECILS